MYSQSRKSHLKLKPSTFTQYLHKVEKVFKTNLKKRQEKPLADVLESNCSYIFRKINRKTPVLELHLNKVAGLNFVKRDSITDVSCEFYIKKKPLQQSIFRRVPLNRSFLELAQVATLKLYAMHEVEQFAGMFN